MPQYRVVRGLVLWVVLLFAVAARGQLVETLEVRVTNVDVIVTDGKGNPVRGLTKEDFVILEDGRPQTITNLYEVGEAQATLAEETPASPGPPLPPDLRRRRVVVFIDNFSIDPVRRNQVLAALDKQLDDLLAEGGEAMIVTWNRSRVVRPFTSDREWLRGQLEEDTRRGATGSFLGTERDQIVRNAQDLYTFARTNPRLMRIGEAYGDSVNAAQSYADALAHNQKLLLAALRHTLSALAGLEGKKVLIFVGGELQRSPALDVFQAIDAIYRPAGVVTSPAEVRAHRDVSQGIADIGKLANATGVTIYMIDTADRNRSRDATESDIPDIEAEFTRMTESPLIMGALASSTGGALFSGTRNFAGALQTVVRDLGSYYSLGYRSDSTGTTTRNIAVRVNRPSVRVRSRRSYAPRSADEEMQDRVVTNVFHPSYRGELFVTVESGKSEQDDGRVTVPLTVTFPSDLMLLPRGDSLVGEFGVYLVVANERGELSPVSKDVKKVTIPASAKPSLGAKPFTYTTRIVLRRGEQSISVAVVDRISGRSGFAKTRIVF